MKILDEFSALPLSRQRKWQLRRRKQHRCMECGVPATGALCDSHCVKRALSQLKLRGVTSGPRRGRWLVMAGVR